jgi:hypothetical protein
MGLVDDFSYVRTALLFAQTGHFIYNGWATAMLGAQILWAAPFIKLLGYSFFAARVSTIVMAVLTVWLTHAMLWRAGLDRCHAVFGALTVGLSPLFIAMSVTFMTDISGLFGIVAGIYCCLRAVEGKTTRGIMVWLTLAAIAGLLGGTARQLPWLIALVMVPSAAWILRRRRGVLAGAAVLWLVSVAAILGCLFWFRHQPFYVPEPLLEKPIGLRSLRELAGTMLAAMLCLALVLMPALASGLQRLKALRAKNWLTLIAVSLAAVWICRFITYHWAEKGLLPWTGDILDKLGLLDYPNAWQLGVMPFLFNTTERAIGSFLVLFTTAVFCFVTFRTGARPDTAPENRPSWSTLTQLLVPFATAYVLLMVPRGLWMQLLDRYLLPLMPIALVFLLRAHQERFSSRLPAVSWVVLAIFSAFSILGTHDWIANHRARLTAVHELEAAGIPAQKIQAGYEFDGTTQIDLRGVVFDPRVTYPAWMDVSPYRPAGLPPHCKEIFNEHTPAIYPELFLAYQQVPCLERSRYGEVSYRTWLPPFHRSILILQPDW